MRGIVRTGDEAAKLDRGSWRSRLPLAAKVLVAAGLLTWLCASGRLDLSSLRDLRDARYLVLAAVSLGLGMVLPIWRWLALLRIQKLDLELDKAISMTWLGYFASLFLPGAVGGDLTKVYLACRNQPGAKARAASTVLMDRILGLVSLLLIAAVAGAVVLMRGCRVGLATAAWTVLGLLAISVGGLCLLLWRPSSGLALRLVPRRYRHSLSLSLDLYRGAWHLLPLVVLYSCLCNGFAIASYLLAALALGEDFSWGQVVALPIVAVVNTLPITPGGLGVGETVGAQLYAEFGSAHGGLVILLVRLGVVVLSVPGALALLGRYRRTREALVAEAEPTP